MTASLTWIGIVVAGLGTRGAVWWDDQVGASLDRAPARKAAGIGLLESCPPEHRAGLAYLVRYLPMRDPEAMAPEALAANVALAYQARAEVPWGASLPGAASRDAVLPHVSATEPREPMRAEFHDRYALARFVMRVGPPYDARAFEVGGDVKP